MKTYVELIHAILGFKRKPISRTITIRLIVFYGLILGALYSSYAQESNDLRRVLRSTKSEKLTQIAEKLQLLNFNQREEAIRMATEKGWIIRQVLEDGTTIQLQKLDALGKPVYYITNNYDAAVTVSTDMVWPGGSVGLNLTGKRLTVGEWDGGAILSTHQELIGRVNQKDNATSLSNHSTHVAGTLIASGVDPLAMGMAYEANLEAYDWTNDETEMAIAGAAGLLLSNHSYGLLTGWAYLTDFDVLSRTYPWLWLGDVSLSSTEDYSFGFYDDIARSWDEIAYNAPYYLIVKSAGNDRGEGPGPGTIHRFINGSSLRFSSFTRDLDGGSTGYDCISSAGLAKNILTIGAVYDVPGGYAQSSDVVMTTFSGWGPTDDGRIKPDICGNGYRLYSTFSTSNNGYGIYSGTSMATPNVTGSLLLLQQYYNQLHPGNFMKASTLKALAIQTADEAGDAEGPDYKFGWGLLNTASAAQLIANDGATASIREVTLGNHKSYSFTFYNDGNSPLKATLCWTDSAGTPVAPQLNPEDLMLVNDLDLRITTSGETFLPYVLNPSQPGNAATTGDNTRDNVEQVNISNPLAGIYTLTVSHKGNLADGAPQDFSLIVSGIAVYPTAPSIAYFSPSMGTAGQTVAIIGSGFLDVTSVTFGGVAARHFLVESDTRILADVGASGATGSVGVSTASGVASSSGFAFIPSDVKMSSVIVDGSANDPDSEMESTYVNWFPVEDAVAYEVYAHGELVETFLSSGNFWAEVSNIYFDVNDDLQYALKVRARLEDGTYTTYGYPSYSIAVNEGSVTESYLDIYTNKQGINFVKNEPGSARFYVYNTSGQLVEHGSFTENLMCDKYPHLNGIYVVKLISQTSEVTRKIVIQNP